jgi:hypothetical protein
MKPIIVTPGDRYGLLEIVRELPQLKGHIRRFECRCSCSNKTKVVVLLTNLRQGYTTSCRCVQKKQAVKLSTTHGKSLTREYKIWGGIMNRCLNPGSDSYRRYGARGITICERWKSFENFLSDMGPRPSLKHSVDRYPNFNGNYEAGNCRWATPRQQARNTRDTIRVDYEGRLRPLIEVCEELGLNYRSIYVRYKNGCPYDKLFIPVRCIASRKLPNEESEPANGLALMSSPMP